MRIAVTGGTGFVGRRLLDALERAGHTPVVLTRSAEKARGLFADRYEIRGVDPADAADLATAIRGAEAIVNLAGENLFAHRWTRKTKQRIRASRVETTRALVSAIRLLDLPDRPEALISASAIGVYGDRDPDVPVDERTFDASRLTPGGFLADVCQAWEREALDAERLGVRVVVLRIGVVLGPGGALEALETPFKLFLGGAVGSGRQAVSWVHITDLVAIVRFVIEHHEIRGPVNAVAPGAVSNRELTRALGRALGRPAWAPVPVPALRLLLGEVAESLSTGQNVRPTRLLEAGFAYRYPTIDEAMKGVYGAAR